MVETTVVHVRDGYDRYIGRAVPRKGLAASPYANPFRVGPDGDREQVIASFAGWVEASPDPRAAYIREHVHELAGLRLGCWCKERDRFVACHGDVLARMAEQARRALEGEAGR